MTLAEETTTPDAILELGFAFWASKALHSAVELGVFTVLAASGPLTADELRRSVHVHPRGALDFFDALVALGLLEREDGRYACTPATAAFLDAAKPGSLAAFLEMAGARPTWAGLTASLRTGEPQSTAVDEEDFFDAVYRDEHRLRAFLRAMTANSAGTARALTTAFGWERHRTVVDVGCAEGGVPVQLALAHDHLSAGGFDLPVVEPAFTAFAAQAGVADRVAFHPGDFFVDPLPPSDVLVMGHVLHDWDLEGKRLLLAKAYAALPPGGALIVYETLIDDARRTNAFGLLMSLNMLVESRGGFDFTGADCRRWMHDAGFAETSTHHLTGPVSMVVGVK